MKKVALIVAGGKGERMNADIPKQFLLLNNLPILMHTIKQFSHFEEIVLVLPNCQLEYWNELCTFHNFTQKHTQVTGGKSRFHSVKNGLEKIDNNSIVAIHDGVRPLISENLIKLYSSKNYFKSICLRYFNVIGSNYVISLVKYIIHLFILFQFLLIKLLIKNQFKLDLTLILKINLV